MKFGVPWKVKGIRPDARETAREAARRAGMSVGEWLNSVIIDTAVEEGVRPKRRGYDDDDDDADDEYLTGVHERIDELTHQLQRLATVGRTGKAPDPDPQSLAEAISRLDRRLDQLINQGPAPYSGPYSGAERRASSSGGQWPAGMDQAIAEITARQQALEADPAAPPPQAAPAPPPQHAPAPPTQNLSGLEQQLRHITTQIESLRQPSGLEEGIAALRGELGEIARTLTEAMPRRAIEAVETEVKALAGRLDSTRNSGVDGSTLTAVERGLTEVRDALRVLTPAESLGGFHEAIRGLSQKIENLASTNPDPAAFQQLEAAIGTLRGILSHVASNEALAQLAGEVRGLAAKIDQVAVSGDSDALTTLEKRIAHIADALETRTQNGGIVPPQLEAVIKGLSDKIERIQVSRGDHMALGHLEDRIVKLVEKLDASGTRFSQLEAIERGLADLLAQMEAQRAGGAAGVSAAVANVDGLQRDLARTQNSLETVHGTLGDVVNRLATIETGMRGEPRTSPEMPKAASLPLSAMRLPTPPAASPPANPPNRATAAAAAAAAMARANPQAARRVIDPNLPPDHPLEPSSGTGRVRGASSPADRIAASEADLGRAKPPVIPDPGGKSNFIAAARRAAQAAATAEPSPSDLRAVAEHQDRDEATLGKKIVQRVRSLFVGASVILIIGGALRIAVNMMDSADPAGTQAPTQAETKSPSPSTKAGDSAAVVTPRIGPAVAPKIPPAQTQASPDITGSVSSATPLWMQQQSSSMPALPPTRPLGGDKLPAAIGGVPLRTAAAAGAAAAEYEVGMRYAEGRGVPVNFAEAARWLEFAAKQGLAPAQFRLGGLYEKGTGVKKDLEMARQLYRTAAEKGHAKAMHNLAVLYAEGAAVKPDYRTAAQWFRKAADHGVSDSQYNLAILYARGIGVEQNLTESYKWFALAAAQGDQEAVKKRDDVGSRLDPQSLTAARLASQAWKAQPQPEEATTVTPPPGGWDAATSSSSLSNPAAMPPPKPKARIPGPVRIGGI
jgi:localization factor PodJL